MKRTNKLLSTFWVKAVPVILMLACIGFTNANAQNYKPLNEAMSSVQTALDDIKGPKVVGQTLNQSTPGSPKTNGMTPSQAASTTVKVFETSYYQRFLDLAKMNGEVPAAMAALDAQFPTTGQQGTRGATISTARGELLHLITY